MKKTMTKRVVTGGIAALLSMGMVLPTFAASASTPATTSNTNTIQVVTKLATLNTSDLNKLLSQFDLGQLNTSQLLGEGQDSNIQQLINSIKGSQTPSTQTHATPAKPATSTSGTPVKSSPTTGSNPTTSTQAPTTGSKPTTSAPSTTAPSTTSSSNGQGNGSTSDSSQFVKQVITLVNQERAKQGLKPLAEDSALDNMAMVKSKDMKNNNYFDHTSPTYGSPFDMMSKFNISYSYAGENIAEGQQTPQDVMNDWMNSEGHRANILNANYTLIGVGYYNGYWTQEFVGRN